MSATQKLYGAIVQASAVRDHGASLAEGDAWFIWSAAAVGFIGHHGETGMCWCQPTLIHYPNGRITVIHKKYADMVVSPDDDDAGEWIVAPDGSNVWPVPL